MLLHFPLKKSIKRLKGQQKSIDSGCYTKRFGAFIKKQCQLRGKFNGHRIPHTGCRCSERIHESNEEFNLSTSFAGHVGPGE